MRKKPDYFAILKRHIELGWSGTVMQLSKRLRIADATVRNGLRLLETQQLAERIGTVEVEGRQGRVDNVTVWGRRRSPVTVGLPIVARAIATRPDLLTCWMENRT